MFLLVSGSVNLEIVQSNLRTDASHKKEYAWKRQSNELLNIFATKPRQCVAVVHRIEVNQGVGGL